MESQGRVQVTNEVVLLLLLLLLLCSCCCCCCCCTGSCQYSLGCVSLSLLRAIKTASKTRDRGHLEDGGVAEHVDRPVEVERPQRRLPHVGLRPRVAVQVPHLQGRGGGRKERGRARGPTPP